MLLAYTQGGSFAHVYQRALHDELDVIAGAARNPERQRHYHFDTLRRGEADLAIGNMKVVNLLIEAGHTGALHTVGIVPREVALLDTLDHALAPWRVQARVKGLALTLEGAFDERVRARCDSVRLGRVVQNLVGNAVKFTGQGGVRVRAAVAGDGAAARLEIEVIDSGPGVPQAEQARLFDAFAQGDAGRRAGQGAGLGLSIVARIVELTGGSVFVVLLPIELLPTRAGPVAAAADAA